MKRILLLAWPLVLAVCATGGCVNQVSRDAQGGHRTSFKQYIIVGDSLMDISSDGELTTTASLLLLEEKKSVANISLGGQTMAGYRAQGGAERDGVSGAINYLTFHGKRMWWKPPGTAVIVELAHNDWIISTSADDFYNSYVRFLQSIDDTDNEVSVFCVVPVAAKWDYNGRKNDLGMTYDAWRDVVRKVASTGLCHLVETTGWFTEEDVFNPLIMSDGLHFAAGGHRIYKDHLIQALSLYK
jgi:hypothetical protein